MSDEDENDRGFSFGIRSGDTEDDSDSDENETEVDEVRTLERTLEQREEQIDKLKQQVAALEQGEGDVPQEDRERIEELEDELEEVREERDELSEENDRLRRLASKREEELREYRNRMEKREEQARSDAIADLVSELSTVRNTLVMALDQDEGSDIRGGVEETLRDLDNTLEDYGLSIIQPSEGDSVDPHKHEVVHRKPSSYESGTVAEVFSDGYEYDGRVIEAARVVVSTGQPDGSDEDEEE